MNILKDGKVKTYLYECSECGCVFTADSTEVMEFRSILGIEYPVMKCPWCKVKVISGSEITEEELEELSKKLEEEESDTDGGL